MVKPLVLVLAAAVTCLPTMAVASTPATVAVQATATGAAPKSESDQAKATGKAVEVLSARTPTDDVMANPDGTFTRTLRLQPIRTLIKGEWKDLDTTLETKADGTIGPKLGPANIVFSGGGSTSPLVAITYREVRYIVGFPDALPTPEFSGSTAVYKEVYPGVDLHMSVMGTGFTQRLILKDRQAAKNPKVRALNFALTTGRKTSIKVNGPGLDVVNASGEAVLKASAPLMWDSTGNTTANVASAGPTDAASAGEKVRSATDMKGANKHKVMGLKYTKGALALSPDTAFLDDAATTYPVVLDPTVTAGLYMWAMVNKTFPTTSYYGYNNADEGVGYTSYEGVHTKRLYSKWALGAVQGKTIVSATLRQFETYSATCAAGSVSAYLTNDFTSSLTWNNQPTRIISSALSSVSTKAGRPDCNPGGAQVEWNVTAGVANRVAANSNYAIFSLQGANETSVTSWMRMASWYTPNTSNRPALSITYNTVPLTLTASTMWLPNTSTACSTTAPYPKINPSLPTPAQVSAKGVDPDGGSVWVQFELRTVAETSVQLYTVGPLVSSSIFTHTILSTLTDGATYYYRARTTDAALTAPFGPNCYFTVDKSAPPMPVITSPVWSNGVLAPNQPSSGTFTLTSPGATSFLHGWSGATPSTLAASGGTATTSTVTAGSTLETYTAKAQDSVGNTSNPTDFVVKRTQAGRLGKYLFNETEGAPQFIDSADEALDSDTTLPGTTTYNAPLTPSAPEGARAVGSGRWGGAATNHAAILQDSATITAPTRPVANEESFTVGGWFYLSDTNSQVLMGQVRDAFPADPSNAAMAYTVTYDNDTSSYTARLFDTAGAVIATATDALPSTMVKTENWVYLAISYQAPSAGVGGTLAIDCKHSQDGDPPGSQHAGWRVGTRVPVTGTPAVGRGEWFLGKGTAAVTGYGPAHGAADNLSIWQGIPSPARLEYVAEATE